MSKRGTIKLDIDRMHWLDRGIAEIDGAETLEDARDEARALVIQAGWRLQEHAEIVWMNGLTRSAGHPFAEAIKCFREAHLKLQEVNADIRARDAYVVSGARKDSL